MKIGPVWEHSRLPKRTRFEITVLTLQRQSSSMFVPLYHFRARTTPLCTPLLAAWITDKVFFLWKYTWLFTFSLNENVVSFIFRLKLYRLFSFFKKNHFLYAKENVWNTPAFVTKALLCLDHMQTQAYAYTCTHMGTQQQQQPTASSPLGGTPCSPENTPQDSKDGSMCVPKATRRHQRCNFHSTPWHCALRIPALPQDCKDPVPSSSTVLEIEFIRCYQLSNKTPNTRDSNWRNLTSKIEGFHFSAVTMKVTPVDLFRPR